MKTFLLLMAAACSFAASAQVDIVGHEQLLKGAGHLYNPVISPDGQKLLVSESDYSGLKVIDLTTKSVTEVADDSMSGFSPAFSKDGKSVYFLSQTVEDKLVYRSMKNYSLSDGTVSTVVGKTRGMAYPVAVEGGLAVRSANGKMLRSGSSSATFVVADGNSLVVTRNGVETRISPVATDYTYMWESLSPDGTKILFYAGGKGAYICDLDGNLVADLGKFTVPVWFNDKYVVAQRSTHDGYQYESSQIVLLGLDGTVEKELTEPLSMAMNPTASVSAGRIAYSTIDGRLFVMDLVIK